jgi:hypothetical protein
MGKVTLLAGHNFHSYARHVGAMDLMIYFNEDTLEIELPDIDQATMDAGLITYAADQANLDSEFADALEDQEGEFVQNEFDDKKDLTALIKVLVDELNAVRAASVPPLPNLNFGLVNAAIRQRIGKP